MLFSESAAGERPNFLSQRRDNTRLKAAESLMNHADELWVDASWLRSTTATHTWPSAGRLDGGKQQIRAVIRPAAMCSPRHRRRPRLGSVRVLISGPVDKRLFIVRVKLLYSLSHVLHTASDSALSNQPIKSHLTELKTVTMTTAWMLLQNNNHTVWIITH